MPVNLGAKHRHDFNPVGAELFPRRFGRVVAEEGDFDFHELADLEADFAAQAQPPVFVGKAQFPDLALQNEEQQPFESGLLVVQSTAQIGDHQIHRLGGMGRYEIFWPRQICLLVRGRDAHITHDQRIRPGRSDSIAPVVADGALWLWQFTLPFPSTERLRMDSKIQGRCLDGE